MRAMSSLAMEMHRVLDHELLLPLRKIVSDYLRTKRKRKKTQPFTTTPKS